jgi:CHAT domain-containing protein
MKRLWDWLILPSSIVPAIVIYSQTALAQPATLQLSNQCYLGLGSEFANPPLALLQQSFAACQRLVELKQQLGDPVGQLGALERIGSLYQLNNQKDKALEAYRQALTFAETLLKDLEARLASNPSAELKLQVNQVRRDQSSILRAIFFLDPASAQGQVAFQLSQKVDGPANGVASQFDQIVGHYDRANQLIASGTQYYRSGQYAQAEQDLKQAATEVEALGASGVYQSITESNTFIEQALPGRTARQQAFDERIDIQAWESQARQVYNQLEDTLIAENKVGEALEVTERRRGRIFSQRLAVKLQDSQGRATSEVDPATTAPLSLQAIQQEARQQQATIVIYSLAESVPGTETSSDVVADLLAQTPPEYRAELQAQLEQLQQISPFALPQTHVAVPETQLRIWVVQPNGQMSFRQPDRSGANLLQTIDQGRNAVATETQRAANRDPALRALYDVLIEPIADLLPSDPNHPVIFVPDERLFLTAFPALPDSQGQYLIETHTIATVPSIQVLQLTRLLSQNRPNWLTQHPLVVGNPTMPAVPSQALGESNQSLASLPSAELEAQAITQLLGTTPLVGEAASEFAVKQQLPQAGVIHLATHGEFDNQNGFDSWIALAPQGNEDGFLNAAEILGLGNASPFQASLAVLSACVSGRGSITGDGVVGLSRSFITAGVPSVVVSLWYVSDESTSFLMQAFYRNLQQGQTKAQALRQAMLATLQQPQYRRPYFWAPFNLIGAVR